MNRVRYELSNLSNSTMKTSLKNALNKIDGVQEVGVNLAQGEVEIGYNGPADERQIINCIDSKGFKMLSRL